MRDRISGLLLAASLVFGCFLIIAASTYAQRQPPPPLPAKDYFPDKWDEYPNAAPIRIRFPKEPQERTDIQGGLAGGPGKGAKVIATTPQQVLIAGDSDQSITVGRMQRSYILHIPPGYNGSARLPLVFVLHGMGGTGKGIEQTTGMSAKADQEKFIVVYPNGVGNPTVWNTGLSDVSNNGADDVGFIRAVMDKLEHDLRIDKNRVYCCGFSSGAIMSYLLGAKLSHRLAAVGIASGTVGNTPSNAPAEIIPQPSEPVPVIAFHGQQDHTIYYNGGGKFVNCLSVADSIAFWVKADSCALPPRKTTRQQGTLKIDDYNSCHDGSEVVLYTFANGTHEWPTLQNNDQLSATDSIWKFFAKHPRH